MERLPHIPVLGVYHILLSRWCPLYSVLGITANMPACTHVDDTLSEEVLLNASRMLVNSSLEVGSLAWSRVLLEWVDSNSTTLRVSSKAFIPWPQIWDLALFGLRLDALRRLDVVPCGSRRQWSTRIGKST